MIKRTLQVSQLAMMFIIASCGVDAPSQENAEQNSSSPSSVLTYDFGLPDGVPAPRVPEDNPMSAAKVALGRHLFYDTRLSGNGTQSCGSCHEQGRAFTDGRATALGSTDEEHFRNSMGLTNAGYNSTFGWAGLSTLTLEDQALIPMFGERPVELGLAGLETTAVADRFRDDDLYDQLFQDAYPEQEAPYTLDNIVKAIAAFERTLVSFDSPFDRHTYGGDSGAMSESAKRGMQLFFSERLECFHCHGGFNFSDSIDHKGLVFEQQSFHNTGLYNLDGEGSYPEIDRGIFDMTGEPHDMGRFKAPTLRNITHTAPYFHDGSAETLEEVIAHYERGGTVRVSGPHIGDGQKSPLKSEFVKGFILSDDERDDLIAFLESLTDETFLTNPAHSDPFAE